VRYGYDQDDGHLFSWDGEFHYLGHREPEGEVETVVDRRLAALAGCGFLSGFSSPLKCVWLDGSGRQEVVLHLRKGSGVAVGGGVCVGRACMCGPGVFDPARMADECRKLPPETSVYACPLIDELPAFGVLAVALLTAGLEHPRRANLLEPRMDDEGVEGMEGREFDLGLGADAIGRMAHLVGCGCPVANEVMRPVGVSPFHGCVLSSTPIPGCAAVIRSALGFRLAPTMTHAMRTAATSVPVEVETANKLRMVAETGRMPVVVASDHILHLPTFMDYLHRTGKGASFMFSSRGTLRDGPVFRYNKGYRRVPNDS